MYNYACLTKKEFLSLLRQRKEFLCMKRIVKYDNRCYDVLVEIWERAVMTTHDFLTEDVIEEIRCALATDYFPAVDLYVVEDDGTPAGFIGLAGDSIEMLFVDSRLHGRGYGSTLVEFALKHGAVRVDVNEQNRSAFEFYEKRGFRVVGRDATDEAGRPYPILHLSL